MSDEKLSGYYLWAFSQDDCKEELDIIRRGLRHAYTEERLRQETALKLYNKEIKGSVSRLESFAACPYKHFLRYGLHLEPREEYRIDPKDIGTLFHDSINEFFLELAEKDLSFRNLDNAARLALVQNSVAKVTSQYAILQDGAHNAYLSKRVERITNRTIETLKRQWEAGTYEHIESEVAFDAKQIPKLQMPISKGVMLSLNGRIDRLDLAEDGNSVWVKVIDYKSGQKALDYSKIYYGIQLQLLLYLKAATEREQLHNPGKEIIPAGIYYYHIDDPIVEESEDPETAIYKELRMKGLTNSDSNALAKLESGFSSASAKSEVVNGLQKKKDGDFDARASIASTEELQKMSGFVLEKSKELAAEVMEGKVSATPVAAIDDVCKYCDYHDICRFDTRMSGYKKKRCEKKTKDDLLGRGQQDEINA